MVEGINVLYHTDENLAGQVLGGSSILDAKEDEAIDFRLIAMVKRGKGFRISALRPLYQPHFFEILLFHCIVLCPKEEVRLLRPPLLRIWRL